MDAVSELVDILLVHGNVLDNRHLNRVKSQVKKELIAQLYEPDGKPKFDLTKFNPAYFDRLRARVQVAGARGIYVSVMLFGGMWGTEHVSTWRGHPFNRENNIDGIDGDVDGDGPPAISLTRPDYPSVVKKIKFQRWVSCNGRSADMVRGIPGVILVADRKIDARPQTGTAPDEKRTCVNPRMRGC